MQIGSGRNTTMAPERKSGLARRAGRAAAWALALAGAAWLTGCQKHLPPALEPEADRTNARPFHLDHAQNNLPVIKLWVGSQELSTEVCLTSQQLATGMMFRTNLAENAAMLFPFAVPHRAAFYMKNTTVPLSAGFIDPEGVIQEIRDLKPLDETTVEASFDQVQYVLEVNQGWFLRHGISTGAVVRAAQGPLKGLFSFGPR
jgi:uncharacterized protein